MSQHTFDPKANQNSHPLTALRFLLACQSYSYLQANRTSASSLERTIRVLIGHPSTRRVPEGLTCFRGNLAISLGGSCIVASPKFAPHRVFPDAPHPNPLHDARRRREASMRPWTLLEPIPMRVTSPD
ncbi:hypothetical protein CCMA1212_002977 [Trichoderma ghanense]|uniref:Uncharacterized protein n=1 Tax=Trichoderma ghanense TaxID=65468 RepID=A0ABY2HD79_9HYPO